jgi:hypothetical protein
MHYIYLEGVVNRKFTSVKFLRGLTFHPSVKESWRKGRALGSEEGKVNKVDSVRMEERRDVNVKDTS